MVYLHLDQCGLHEVVLGSRYFAEFVEFLVSGRRINSLLLKCLRLDRLQEAVQLVGMYYKQHNIKSVSTEGKEMLKVSSHCRSYYFLLDEVQTGV